MAEPKVDASPASGSGLWPMTQESRAKIVDRIASHLAAISFFSSSGDSLASRTARLDDAAAREHALAIEKEAFQAADAMLHESGSKVSHADVVISYANRAGEAMTALLKSKALPPSKAAGSVPAVAAVEPGALKELDLSVSGKREFLDEEKARELLKPMLEANPNRHHRVRLSTKCFRPAASGVAATALRNASATLEHADLSDIIAGQPEEDALSSLKEISSALAGVPLKSLDLSNNALGEKGVRACAAMLSTQTGLESLHFCNVGVSPDAAEAIAELLPTENVASLRTLHFHNNCTEDKGALALAKLVKACAASRLSDFRFSSTRVQSDGGVALAEALGHGSSLKRVDLRDNMFGEAALALAKALGNHSGLTEAYLGDTSLGDEGACAVAEALAANCKELEVLDLGGNDITPEAAARLAASLAGLPRLKRLTLCLNELQDEGTEIICKAVTEHIKELEVLDLCTNEITAVGAKAAAEAACELPKLKSLLLNGNAISKAGVEELTGIMKGCTNGLEVLGPLDENDDGEDDDE